jgi:hypothetical protein
LCLHVTQFEGTEAERREMKLNWLGEIHKRIEFRRFLNTSIEVSDRCQPSKISNQECPLQCFYLFIFIEWNDDYKSQEMGKN